MSIRDYSTPLDDQGGDQVLNRIKEYLGTTRCNAIAEIYGVKPNTMSTWSKCEHPLFELAVRMNICEGIPLKWLLFGEGEMLMDSSNESKTVRINQFELINGELITTSALELDRVGVPENFDIPSHAIAVKVDKTICIVNEQNTVMISGDYLIDMTAVLLLLH